VMLGTRGSRSQLEAPERLTHCARLLACTVDFEVWLDKSNTRYWLAPELLLSEPFPYGCEVDIWSLGCIIIEMADGRPPYSAFHPLKEFFYTATKGAPTLENPAQWSLHFRNFLAAALRPDPSKRATATELLQVRR